MAKARALSSDEIRGLREELTGGGTPTVWFTASAVGVPEGRSGKVIALDEPAEGDFIQVRPAGSKDVLSFSAAEVTLVKPARKRKEPEPAAKATSPAGTGSAGTSAAASGGGAAGGSGKAGPQGAAGSGSKPAVPNDAGGTAKAASAPKAGSKPAPSADSPAADQKTTGNTGTAARRKPKSPAGASVVLTADQAGQWNVEVSTGKKRALRPTPVPASAVAQAAKSLHPDVAAAVEPLLEAARDQQRDRVEQLQRELAEAQRKLDELAD